jgi:hypothetical protein
LDTSQTRAAAQEQGASVKAPFLAKPVREAIGDQPGLGLGLEPNREALPTSTASADCRLSLSLR